MTEELIVEQDKLREGIKLILDFMSDEQLKALEQKLRQINSKNKE